MVERCFWAKLKQLGGEAWLERDPRNRKEIELSYLQVLMASTQYQLAEKKRALSLG